MRTRFLLGPAGSGKTFRCLAEIGEELKSAPEGLPLVLLAPKQATFQLERQLLAGPDLPGYTRLQILSFERLAEFVLAEYSPSAVTVATRGPSPLLSKKTGQHSDPQREFPFWELAAVRSSGSARESLDFPVPATHQSMTGALGILDEEGRVMVLRALLTQKQEDLKIYRATARLPGFAQQLSLLLRELQRHQHSPEKLFALATQIHLPPRLADKLHDLALLLRAYHDWLKKHQLQDVNSLLDLATEALRLPTARPAGSVVSGSPSIAQTTRQGHSFTEQSGRGTLDGALCFGGLWLDGFAEMTPQELDFLARLTPLCAQSTLAFCLENKPAEDLSWLSTWSVVGQTFRKSYQRLAALPGCEVEVEILQRKLDRGRFVANPVLAHLEKNWSQPKPFENRSDVSHGSHEPTPNPSQEGNRQDADERLLPSWEGSGVGRFMDSDLDPRTSVLRAIRVNAAVNFWPALSAPKYGGAHPRFVGSWLAGWYSPVTPGQGTQPPESSYIRRTPTRGPLT